MSSDKDEPACDTCGSTGPLYLHSRCHSGMPTWTKLDGDTLHVECAVCGQNVASFRVDLNSWTEPCVGAKHGHPASN